MENTLRLLLKEFPPDNYLTFENLEFENRVEAARRSMRSLEIDAILVSSEANFRYLTGYILQSPVQIARPRFFVLPLSGEPCAIVPKTNVEGMRKTTWVKDIRSWIAPNPEDDGVSLVVEAMQTTEWRFGRFGAELGQEARLGMPVLDFLRLKDMLEPWTFVDAERVFREIRMVKSPAEIDRIRRICRITSDAFAALPCLLDRGDTEWSACRRLQLDVTLRGAHRTPHLTGVSGYNGYTNINTGPTGRVLGQGDVLTIDAGCCIDNYWCDFNRNFAFGRASDPVLRAYQSLFEATEAGLRAVRPGQRTSDVFAAMCSILHGDGAPGGTIGRMGHGIGLLAPEPPSVNSNDTTVLRPGMVITLEPSISFMAPGSNGEEEQRIMVHEENLVVTNNGAELLTTRAPEELPIIR
jgi:Xaa-Pro aminopeptidase